MTRDDYKKATDLVKLIAILDESIAELRNAWMFWKKRNRRLFRKLVKKLIRSYLEESGR